MLAMRTISLLAPAALSACLALAGCGPATPDPNDPSSEDATSKPQKPAEQGPDASLLGEIRQLTSLLAAIDKSDSGHPKALDRLGELYAELSKSHRDRAIAADPNAASLPPPPEPKSDGVEGEGPAKPAAALPPRPDGPMKRLKPEAKQHISVADKMAAEAIKSLRKLLEEHPDYKDLDKVLFRLGGLYVLYGQGSAARPIYFRLIEKYPKSPLVPEAYWNFAEFFFAEEDFENAYKLYAKVVEYPPSERTSVAGYKLALSFHKVSRLDESWKALEGAASAARIHGPPGTVDDIYRDAPKLAATRKPLSAPDAAAFFGRLAESNEDVIKQALNRLGQILEDEGRPLEATEVLHVMTDRYPAEKCAIQARSIEIATRSGNNAIRADEVKRSLRLGCKP
jgi:TolA-binding protein